MPADYDVSQAYKRIENELIDSMMRNLDRHRAEELAEGFNWEQWQVVQLKELERYRLENADRFTEDFKDIHQTVSDAFWGSYATGETTEEAKILEQVLKGKLTDGGRGANQQFFGVNSKRVNALVDATKADFTRGEHALLRTANDQYRKIIFNAQMYSATGATYEQAVDMATKDFLKNGIQCITYKNGAVHNIQSYSRMAVKTGQKRAYLMGEGNANDKYGIHTVRVNKRTDACPYCVGWLGKVLVDDVYSGGTQAEADKLGVPTLSEAMDMGFLHPNCKDVYSLYIEGVSKPADPYTKEEIQKIADNYNADEALRRAEDMQDSYNRMAKYSLDPVNQARYQARADAWGERVDLIKDRLPITPIAPVMPEPEPPKMKVLTAQTADGKTISMKQLSGQTTGKAVPFEKKLTPSLADYQAQIKALEKAKAGDDVMKPLLEKALVKAEENLDKVKASGASKQKIGGASTQKSAIEKKIKVIDTKAEVKALEADVASVETKINEYELLHDAGFTGVWQDTVYLSEYLTYEPKLQSKITYFQDKIAEWKTKGVANYGKTQAEVDAKVAQLQKQLDTALEYKKEGIKYQLGKDALDDSLKVAQEALANKEDELLKLQHPKHWKQKHAGVGGQIDQARRDQALWAKDPKEADNALRAKTGEVWRNASKVEKDAIYEYTVSYNKFNEPLRGIEYGTNAYKGVGNTTLNPKGNGIFLNAMTDIIEKSSYDVDMWFQRGVSYRGMDKFFGVPNSLLVSGTQAELEQALLDKVVTEYGFMSMGSAKGQGFSGNIVLNIFAPKGTKMMYAEPFSGFGHGGGRMWDGIASQSYFGGEFETILQQNTQFKIVKIERTNGTLYVDLDIIGQSTPQRWVK